MAVAVVAVVFVVAGCTSGTRAVTTPANHVAADLTDYRGNVARTGQMPGPGLRASAVTLWRYRDPSAIGLPPAVAAGQVLVPENQSLVALDLAGGARAWAVPLGAGTNAPVTVASGTALVTTTDNVVHAINLATHQERWRFQGAADGAQLSIQGATVYLGTQRHEFVALDVVDGTRQWSISIGHGGVKNAIADGVAYVGGDSGSVLTAINLADRKIMWSFDTHGDRLATPAVDHGTVYVAGIAASGLAGRNTNLFALDAVSGRELWRFAPPNDPAMAAFAVGANDVFIGLDSTPGTLYAINRLTGKVHWQAPIAGAVDRPALVDDLVYVAAGPGGLHAFDVATGRQVWTAAIPGYCEGVVVTDGIALVATRGAPDTPGVVTALVGMDDDRAPAP
ncbi:MAG: PQQ-binding-like beta-propeller repeat protein [Pseudonocardiales bacterium]